MTDDTTRHRLLAEISDTPLHVETRAILLDARSRVHADAGGAVIVDEACALAAIHRRPGAALVATALADAKPGWEAIAPDGGGDTAVSGERSKALSGWDAETAIIHTLDSEDAPPPRSPGLDVDLRLLRADSVLEHVPRELRSELELALGFDKPVVAAWVDGVPVSFCTAYCRTETLWDVSIDTLAPYRRRGLASAAAAHMIELQRAAGRAPVWGAVESNRASRELARHLGFVPHGRLRLWTLTAAD